MTLNNEIFPHILEIFPVEVIEKVSSFCDGKEILHLTETCKMFRDIVGASTSIIKKLRVVIDLKLHLADKKAIKKCIESRRFSAARLDIIGTDNWAIQKGFLEIAEQLEGIKDLVINCPNTSKKLETLQLLTTYLLPQTETCKIIFKNDEFRSTRTKLSSAWNFSSTEILQVAKCDFLTDLHVVNCNFSLLTHVLLQSKNLKRLTIEDGTFFSEVINTNGTSAWKLLTFKLKKLELLGKHIVIGETFKEFLKDQTDLREISIRGDFNFNLLLELQPNIEIINLSAHSSWPTAMGKMPHQLLHKFRLIVEAAHRDEDKKNSLFIWIRRS